MTKKINIKISTTVKIFLVLLFLTWIFLLEEETGKYSENNQIIEKNIENPISSFSLQFKDNQTGCLLNGEIYSGNTLIGNVIGGKVELSYEDMQKIIKEELFYISGKTDYCFGSNSELPFYRAWTFVDWDYLFETGESENFVLNLNPRWPIYPEEMKEFVRPEETKEYLEQNIRKYFNEDIEENLDRINRYSIRYRSDQGLFGKEEYWQTPAETLKKGHGDCEDWAVTTLSLMKSYNTSLECYNALWDTHLSIMCFLGNKLLIYDQGNTKFSQSLNLNKLLESEKKVKIRKVIYQYLDSYGLGTENNEIYALFNDNQLVPLEGTEDLIEWIINK